MSDVNFLEYGYNALRVQSTLQTGSTFLADNGYLIGVFLVIIFLICLIAFVFILGKRGFSGLGNIFK